MPISSNYLETTPSTGLLTSSYKDGLYGRDRIGHTTPYAVFSESYNFEPHAGPSGSIGMQGVEGVAGTRLAGKAKAATNIARVSTLANKSVTYNAANLH